MQPARFDFVSGELDVLGMKRKLYKTSALVSFLLFGGTVWWWMHSTSRVDEVTYERPGVQSVHVWGTGGKFTITRTVFPGAAMSQNPRQVTWGSTTPDPKAATAMASASTLGFMPFAYDQQPLANASGPSKGAIVSRLILPAWLVAAVFALPPALWVAPKLKKKKKPAKES
jgi:hypothetical protein